MDTVKYLNIVNKILVEFKLKETFTQKSNKKFGIRNTTKFDNKTPCRALYDFVIQAPFNNKLYDAFVSVKLLPKFHIGDLVCWKKEYCPVKEDYLVDYERIDIITDIQIDEYGSISYLTKETNPKDDAPAQIGNTFDCYLVKVGTSPFIDFPLLGKEQDMLSQVHALRLINMFQEEVIKKIHVPGGHKFDDLFNDSNWFGGYALGNISTHLRGDKTNLQLHGEIRIHLRKSYGEKLSATLWLNQGSEYYLQHKDLLSSDRKERFIYADNYLELFEKIVTTYNNKISSCLDSDGNLITFKSSVAA